MANVVLRFLGDSDSLDRTFRKVTRESDKFGAGVKRGLGLGAVSAAAAGAALAKFGGDSVKAFQEAEKAQSRLEDAFKRFPALADTNIGALRKLNTQLAQKTRFDDDATASGQAVLAQFKLTGSQIRQLTPLLQDYAAKTGKDLPTAAQDLGKALLGQGRALKQVGIQFKDLHDPTANFEQLVGALNEKVGGFAEKEGKTAAGRAEILKNKFGELQEKVGSMLVPALEKLVNGLIGVSNWYTKLDPQTKTMVNVTGLLVGAVVGLAAAVKATAAATALLNLAMDANPFVLVATASFALGLALAKLYESSKPFKDFVNRIGNDFIDAANLIVKGINVIIRAYNLLPFHKDVGTVDPIRKIGAPQDPKVRVGDARAHGGPVLAGQSYTVGERGPERLTMGSQNGYVSPNGGGGSSTVNIYMPAGSSGEDVVAAIQRYNRRNGKGWMSA